MSAADGQSDAHLSPGDSVSTGVTRREVLEVAAGALVTASMIPAALTAPAEGSVLPQAAQSAPRFFTPEQFKLVDELSEMIIPTDSQSSGARAAGVATYIDARLADTTEAQWKESWRNGLKLVEDLSSQLHGKTFMASSPEQRLATLTRMAANELNPKTPTDQFFRELKFRVVRGYYSSKIGVQIDQTYKGNVIQPGEYAGIDVRREK